MPLPSIANKGSSLLARERQSALVKRSALNLLDGSRKQTSLVTSKDRLKQFQMTRSRASSETLELSKDFTTDLPEETAEKKAENKLVLYKSKIPGNSQPESSSNLKGMSGSSQRLDFRTQKSLNSSSIDLSMDKLSHDLTLRASSEYVLKKQILFPASWGIDSKTEINQQDLENAPCFDNSLNKVLEESKTAGAVAKDMSKVNEARERARINAQLQLQMGAVKSRKEEERMKLQKSGSKSKRESFDELENFEGMGPDQGLDEELKDDEEQETFDYNDDIVEEKKEPFDSDNTLEETSSSFNKKSLHMSGAKKSVSFGPSETQSAEKAYTESEAFSEISLTEKLCLLQDSVKQRPKTLKERFIGHRRIPGYLECVDTTEGYPQCLPPGELVRKAIQPSTMWGIPENCPLSREMIIYLMRQMENRSNNEYLYLVHDLPVNHPKFNPYSFRIVKPSQLNTKNYLSMSKYGVLKITECEAYFISMINFEKEMLLYDKILSIKFFARYRLWKAFCHWQKQIRVSKFTNSKASLKKTLFTAQKPLRNMLLELNKMCEIMSSLNFLRIHATEPQNMMEFSKSQAYALRDAQGKLKAFEATVIDMTDAACRARLIKEGFSPDKYAEEMQFYLKEMGGAHSNLLKSSKKKAYPGQWLTYTQQSKKRRLCHRLTDFIRLVDYKVQRTYLKLFKNSLFNLVFEMAARAMNVQKPNYVKPTYIPTLRQLRDSNKKYGKKVELSDTLVPLLEVGIHWTQDHLIGTPSLKEYTKCLLDIIRWWRLSITKYTNMLLLPTFDPYTKPIINGHVEEKVCGDGPKFNLQLEHDTELERMEKVIMHILKHSFQSFFKYIKVFDHIRKFSIENQRLNLNKFKKETDIRVFTAFLEKFHAQLEIVKTVDDTKNLGVLRVNNDILRGHANPTIYRCLEVLHEVVPKIAAKSTRQCLRLITLAFRILNKAPETIEDYVTYLLFLEDVQDKMDAIQKEWDRCAEFYDLMDVFDIAALEEDLRSFHDLPPHLHQLKIVIDKQLGNRFKLTNGLRRAILNNIDIIRERMSKIEQALQLEEITDPDSDPTKILRKLNVYEACLLQDEQLSERYKKYQQDLKMKVSKFEDLRRLIDLVVQRKEQWEAIQAWKEKERLELEGDEEEETEEKKEEGPAELEPEEPIDSPSVIDIMKTVVPEKLTLDDDMVELFGANFNQDVIRTSFTSSEDDEISFTDEDD